MANPSLRKGYASIANELIEQLALHNIPGEEMRILWVVIRHTWSWQDGDRKKDWDRIAISQFVTATGMKRGNVVRATAKLVAKRLLLETEKGYKINQNYDEWVVAKRLPPVVNRLQGSSQLTSKSRVKRLLSKEKRNISKEINTGDASVADDVEIILEVEEAKTRFNDLGKEIIKAFEAVNPACKRYYGNTTQRAACDNLIREYSLERVLKVIALLPRTNNMAYLPTITTPAQLEAKWSALEAGLIKKKQKSQVFVV